MTREEAIKRLEVVRTNALIQKANGASEYWQEEIDGTIEAIDMAIEALSADAVEVDRTSEWVAVRREEYEDLIADAEQGEWIPCGEKMPKELERVNVTWLNHNPPFYYQHIKDIPQTDTAVYYRGKWYWWDATVIDVLAEYGEDCNAEQIDKDIEVVAWMPLPTPYKGGDDE